MAALNRAVPTVRSGGGDAWDGETLPADAGPVAEGGVSGHDAEQAEETRPGARGGAVPDDAGLVEKPEMTVTPLPEAALKPSTPWFAPLPPSPIIGAEDAAWPEPDDHRTDPALPRSRSAPELLGQGPLRDAVPVGAGQARGNGWSVTEGWPIGAVAAAGPGQGRGMQQHTGAAAHASGSR
jgi:hypothetical protein